jgi:hypothetical protein
MGPTEALGNAKKDAVEYFDIFLSGLAFLSRGQPPQRLHDSGYIDLGGAASGAGLAGNA